MKRTPKVGETGEQSFVVQPSHTIDVLGNRKTVVLSTPSLIWFLEHAARDALASLLDPDETSVGVSVDVEHLAATPLGYQVTCVARVVHVDRHLITFQVTAEDGRETIARGVHRRRVIGMKRFEAHLLKKMDGARE